MPSSPGPSLYPILATALTHIHVGAGRSPGVVDLPVVRDPLGFFYIPGSSLKGSIKSVAALLRSCITEDKINCSSSNECSKLCCLLGGEVGEAAEAPSRLSIGDLYPLLVPVPSLSHGFLYATSPLLIARARTIEEATGTKVPLLDSLLSELEKGVEKLNLNEDKDAVLLGASDSSTISIGITEFNVGTIKETRLNEIAEGLRDLSSIYVNHPLQGSTIVVKDEFMPLIIERTLVRLTRVRLDRTKKTVVSGMLWTEEYIPQFTLFVGHIADTGHSGRKYCSNNGITDAVQELLNLMNASNRSFAVVVGGKEAVGKGLLHIIIENQSSHTNG